jgi:hypothetical protein
MSASLSAHTSRVLDHRLEPRPALGEELVGGTDRGGEDAVAEVVFVAEAAGAGREHGVVGSCAVGAGFVGGEFVAEDRQEGDLAQVGLGLERPMWMRPLARSTSRQSM